MKKIVGAGILIVSLLIGSILVLAQADQNQSHSSPRMDTTQLPSVSDREEDAMMSELDPFIEMERMHRELERLMHSRAWGSPHPRGHLTSHGYLEPRIDLEETTQELVLRCDLPGLDKDKISIKLKNDVVEIQAKREIVREDKQDRKGTRFYRSERSVGSFYRAIPLPVHVDQKNVKASYQNGVLTLRLPKIIKEEEKSVQIPIN